MKKSFIMLGIKMKKPKDYHERKPNVETEMFRAWTLTDEERAGINHEGDVKINFNGLPVSLTGFNKIRNEKKELVFAYKLKPSMDFLYYIPDDLSKEDKIKCDDVLNALSEINRILGYSMTDMREQLKAIYNEKHLLDKLNMEKK